MITYIRAFVIMFIAHFNQRDKGGKPYFMHPIRVSNSLLDKRDKIVGLLHDVLEDSNRYCLKDFDFLDYEQIEALKLLTHDKDVDYSDYIKSIKNNNMARRVKIMDLKDNMNIKRISKPTEKDFKKVEEYTKAKQYLMGYSKTI